MTNIIYAVIDNHKKQKKTCYDIIFKTNDLKEFQKYIKSKGLD